MQEAQQRKLTLDTQYQQTLTQVRTSNFPGS